MGPGSVLPPENLGPVRIETHFARVIGDSTDEARRQQVSQGILVRATQSIGEWLKAMTAQNKTVVLNLPEVFALVLIQGKILLLSGMRDRQRGDFDRALGSGIDGSPLPCRRWIKKPDEMNGRWNGGNSEGRWKKPEPFTVLPDDHAPLRYRSRRSLPQIQNQLILSLLEIPRKYSFLARTSPLFLE
jgi:hypothetical protein